MIILAGADLFDPFRHAYVFVKRLENGFEIYILYTEYTFRI